MNAAKTNHISLSFDAISENEAFARMTAAMFMAQLNPTLDDVVLHVISVSYTHLTLPTIA